MEKSAGMKSPTKKCQTCTKQLPREGPPCCEGRCKELYDKRRATRRAKPEHKEYHRLWRKTSKGKALKKRNAAKFNATDKGRVVKRRSDKKYYSTTNGNVRVRMQRRFKEIMTMTGRGGKSAKLEKYGSLHTTKQITEWASKFGTPEEVKDMHIDHIIPCAAFAWEWDGDTLVRATISDDEMCKLWNPDNLQLISPTENMTKGCMIPDDNTLMKIRHCWPSYWKDCLPQKEAKEILSRASRKNVRVLE